MQDVWLEWNLTWLQTPPCWAPIRSKSCGESTAAVSKGVESSCNQLMGWFPVCHRKRKGIGQMCIQYVYIYIIHMHTYLCRNICYLSVCQGQVCFLWIKLNPWDPAVHIFHMSLRLLGLPWTTKPFSQFNLAGMYSGHTPSRVRKSFFEHSPRQFLRNSEWRDDDPPVVWNLAS